jgi:hypothetical protein
MDEVGLDEVGGGIYCFAWSFLFYLFILFKKPAVLPQQ